jgi:hypothetical protein
MLLAAVLAVEGALYYSLRALGWLQTSGALLWGACAFLAALPLTLAVIVLLRQRLRFSLRSLLIAMMLTSLFMGVSVLPLYRALDARRGTQAVKEAGGLVSTEVGTDDFYERLGFDPRAGPPPPGPTPEAPAWLRPLARGKLSLPADATIRAATLEDDSQIEAFCRHYQRFRSLSCLNVGGPSVTPRGMAQLAQVMPALASVEELHVNCPIPNGWLRHAPPVRSLFLWSERNAGAYFHESDLKEVGQMANLQVVHIYLYRFRDDDLPNLAASASLRRVIMKFTNITQQGLDLLSARLPAADIHAISAPYHFAPIKPLANVAK